MNFSIKVIATSVENKGKYNMAEVTYKRVDTGKVESKKLMSFVFPAVYAALATADSDSIWTITSEKNEKTTYWDWTLAVAGESAPSVSTKETKATSTGSTPVRSTYETQEERAKKQVYIVKQSALDRAVDICKHNNPKGEITVGSVIAAAQPLVDWVFAEGKAVALVDMPDDVFPD